RSAATVRTTTPEALSVGSVQAGRGAAFAAARRVGSFAVPSVVSFRVFLGKSHPFVFRSRLQNQGVRFDVKIRRSAKVDAQNGAATFRTDAETSNRQSERAPAKRARRFRSSN
ncbi:MAG: hypothetical protein IKU86_08950, partial [Thermoguttaceae bacterium]|nr:hypothetical protein [Thermoguttaceae bacterium]